MADVDFYGLETLPAGLVDVQPVNSACLCDTVPVVVVVSPTEGTTIGPFETLVIDITNNPTEVHKAMIAVRYGNRASYDVIFDGYSFAPKFGGSFREEQGADGFRYHLKALAGWAGNLEVRVFPANTVVQFSWPVEYPSEAMIDVRQDLTEEFDPLGCGIIRPFHRTPRADLDNAAGVKEVLSCVGQVLGTTKGALWWRPDFGSELHRLRHKNNTTILADTARVMCEEALRLWEPRAALVAVTAEAVKNFLTVLVTVRIAGVTSTVRVPVGSISS